MTLVAPVNYQKTRAFLITGLLTSTLHHPVWGIYIPGAPKTDSQVSAMSLPENVRRKAEDIGLHLLKTAYPPQESQLMALHEFWRQVNQAQILFSLSLPCRAGQNTRLSELSLLPHHLYHNLDLPLYLHFLKWGMPANRIGLSKMNLWRHTLRIPAITPYGQIVGFGKYALFDPGWLISSLNHLARILGLDHVVPFNPIPARQVVSPSTPDITLALAGDWGSGTFAARAVMNTIAQVHPDYVIHLGDIYYSGTPEEIKSNYLKYFKGGSRGAFMLNSNHEMDSGGKGYFYTALNHPLFRQQENSSFFVIEYGRWAIIGLDSAYDAGGIGFISGRIKHQSQLDLIRYYHQQGRNLILLSHHNPVAEDGLTTNELWNDVVWAMKAGRPDYWYYGHLHTGVAYSGLSATSPTRLRCVGHGGMAMGHASGFYQPDGSLLTSIDHYAYRQSTSEPDRALNGFILLTISQTYIREQFFYQNSCNERFCY